MQSIALNKIAPLLRDGHCILVSAGDGTALIADAKNELASKEIRDLKGLPPEKGFRILIDSDARLNRHVREVPALAWDIIDTSDNALVLILPGGYNVSKNVLDEDGNIAIQMASNTEELKLVQAANCPLILTQVNTDEFPQNFSSIDYIINLPALLLKNSPSDRIPIVFLGPDNEVRIIRE